MKYVHLVCGGTFDRLHKGHRAFLEAACRYAQNITVGLTSDLYVQRKKDSEYIQAFHIRKKAIERILQVNARSWRVIQIENLFGDTLTNVQYDAIAVTDETKKGAQIINKRRVQLGLKPLKVLSVPYVLDQNNTKISSQQIRKGSVSRQGKSYDQFLFSREIFNLPDSLKKQLRIPLGRIHEGPFTSFFYKKTESRTKKQKKQENLHIAVGDIVTQYLKESHIFPLISLVDGRTQRKALDNKIRKQIFEKGRYIALNKKSTIQKEAIRCIQKMMHGYRNKAVQQLEITGEEDLLVLPVVLLAPLGSVAWYGIRQVGAVEVVITEKIKEKVYNLMKQFN